jgi:hypothetical protein
LATAKIVVVEGTLTSDDGRYHRKCKVRIIKRLLERGGYLRYVRQNVSVIDSDDFPIGVYTLLFQGQTDRRKRTWNGKYVSVSV